MLRALALLCLLTRPAAAGIERFQSANNAVITPSTITIASLGTGVLFTTSTVGGGSPGTIATDPMNFSYVQSASGGPLLGVGTNVASTTVHVVGSTSSRAIIVNSPNPAQTGGAAAVGEISVMGTAYSATNNSMLDLLSYSTNAANPLFRITNHWEGSSSSGTIALGSYIGSTYTDVLYVTTKSAVGVNQAVPAGTLDVKSTSTASGTPAVIIENNSGTSIFQVNQGGNVGIGTTAPGRLLDVNGGGVIRGAFDVTSGSVTVAGQNMQISSGTLALTGNASTPFQIGNATFTVSSSGNVGIGLASPASALDVSGSIHNTNQSVSDGSSTIKTTLLIGGNGSGTSATIDFTGPQAAQPATSVAGARDWGYDTVFSGTTGGRAAYGLSNAAGGVGYAMLGVIGSASPTAGTAAVQIRCRKSDGGTSIANLAAGDTCLTVVNSDGTNFASVLGNGNTGIGTTTPATVLDVNGAAQFGSGATKSTFTAAGLLNLDSGAALQRNSVNVSSWAATGNLSGTYTNTTLGPCIAGSTVSLTLTAGSPGLIDVFVNGSSSVTVSGAVMGRGLIVDGAFIDGETSAKGLFSPQAPAANVGVDHGMATTLTGLSAAQHNICLSLFVSAGTGTIDSVISSMRLKVITRP